MIAVKKYDQLATPDFLVHWGNTSSDVIENVYCELPARISADRSLRKAVAHLQTATTSIEVSDLHWNEPTDVTLTPNRLGFCLLVSTSTAAAIKCGYRHEAENDSRLGHVLLFFPGKEIKGRSGPGSYRTITCSFETTYAESIIGPLSDLSETQLLYSLDVRNALISTILLRLMNEALYPGPLADTVVESFGQAMLVECAHWLLMEDSKLGTRGQLTARHFSTIEEYLGGLSGKLPSVSEIATACGFSERYFAKLFREQTGCSVAQYIKSAQITKAKTYLLETDLSLKQIAYRLGFSTPANFSSAFRTATDGTPGQFRKQFKRRP